MNCEIKILSHACMLVKTERSSVILDPWLLGSCYWTSWWNFPEPQYDVDDINSVDAVVISHLHWDHWHGPTLKKLFKNKPIIINDAPNTRSSRDLSSVGFSEVNKIKHGNSIDVGNIKVTFYHFGLFETDSVIVIEADGVTILNANDAKIAGLPLKNILDNHGPIDFALRSHSSANPRICYEIPNDKSFVSDNRSHYLESFKLFMDQVNPSYAIPFASNHCHLSDDCLKFNNYISDPLELRKYISSKYNNLNWELKVMLPGSKWSKSKNFDLSDEVSFLDKNLAISNYRQKVQDRLDFYNAKESEICIDDKLLNRFTEFLVSSRSSASSISIRFLITSSNADNTMAFNLSGQKIERINDISSTPKKNCPLVIMPNIVFRDSIIKNMFQHASISKRCRYVAYDRVDMKILTKFIEKLERYELTGKINLKYLVRLTFAYIRRWRELIVYMHAWYLHTFKGLEMYTVEEHILKK